MSDLIKFSFMMVVTLAVVVLIFGTTAGFTFPAAYEYKGTIILLSLFGTIAFIYTYIRPDDILSRPSWSIFVYSLFIPVGFMFSYLMGSLNMPLADALFAKTDAMLGFHWGDSFAAFGTLPPWTAKSALAIYHSGLYVMLAVVALLVFTARRHRLDEFVTLFILTGIVTSAVSGFLPAANAFEYFKPDPILSQQLAPAVGPGYMADFFALRDGSLRVFKLLDSQGIVSFPSFHTITALLLIYATRGMGLLFAASLTWNSSIIITTPLYGAHYLTDVIGGAVITILAVVLVKRLEPWLAEVFSRSSPQTELRPQNM